MVFILISFPLLKSKIFFTFQPPVWANHGDDVSIQYSGTPALKGDFVRYLLMDLFKFLPFVSLP